MAKKLSPKQEVSPPPGPPPDAPVFPDDDPFGGNPGVPVPPTPPVPEEQAKPEEQEPPAPADTAGAAEEKPNTPPPTGRKLVRPGGPSATPVTNQTKVGVRVPTPVSRNMVISLPVSDPAEMFYRVSDMSDKLRVLLYGASGVGKTTLAATAPSPVFLDLEHSTMVLHGKDIMVREITSVGDFRASLEALRQLCATKRCPYETVVVDTFSELSTMGLGERLYRTAENPEDPQALFNVEIGDYGFNTQQMKQLLREVMTVPLHVIVIAQESMDNNPLSKWNTMPALSTKVMEDALAAMYGVFHLSQNKEGERILTCNSRSGVVAKDRSRNLDAVYASPNMTTVFNKMLAK